MRFFKDMWTGFRAFYRAIGFVFDNGLWPYFLIPAALDAALYFSGDSMRQDLYRIDMSAIAPEDYNSLLIVGLKAIFVFVAARLSNVVVLIILSPLLALLSARTERILEGNHYPFSMERFLKDIRRGINIALRNAAIQLTLVAIWLFVCIFISGLVNFTGWFIFVIGFYFYGFSLLDYTNERKQVDVGDAYKFIREHAGLTISIGGIFSAIILIPHAGIILAPIIGIVAATIGFDMIRDLKHPHVKEEMKGREEKGSEKPLLP